jgi:hypothetical protein
LGLSGIGNGVFVQETLKDLEVLVVVGLGVGRFADAEEGLIGLDV